MISKGLVKGFLCVFLCVLLKLLYQFVYFVCFGVFLPFVLSCQYHASNCLERLVSEMTCYCVERDVKLYSLTHSRRLQHFTSYSPPQYKFLITGLHTTHPCQQIMATPLDSIVFIGLHDSLYATATN